MCHVEGKSQFFPLKRQKCILGLDFHEKREEDSEFPKFGEPVLLTDNPEPVSIVVPLSPRFPI